MRVLFLVLSWMVFPALPNAAPLSVLTGEHASFTRVVINVPRDTEWQLGRTAKGYVLRIPVKDGFVLDQFYDLIPPDRIAAVSQEPTRGEIQFELGCICHAQASIYRSDYLVIDIRDGPAPNSSPFELPIAAEEWVDGKERTVRPLPRVRSLIRDSVLPVITPRVWQVEVIDQDVKDEGDLTSPPLPEVESDLSIEADQALEMIAQSLNASVGRALSDGFLEQANLPRNDDSESVKDPAALLASRATDFPGINATTSLDPLAVSSAEPKQETQVGQTCLADSHFNIASWGDDRSPYAQLGQARAALVSPADQIETDGLIALARLYVFLGFGREALQVLDMDGVQSRDRMILRALAHLIDDEPVSSELFSGQVSCPTPVALWALLAQDTAPTDAEVDRSAVVNAYQALPKTVQTPIASRLAEALLAIGAQDAAIQVLDRTSGSKTEDVALALAQATLAGALGEDVQAFEKVAEIARDSSRTTPKAMTRFLVEGARNGITFSDDDFLLADALRFENTGDPMVNALTSAQFDAYLSVDRFEEARALLTAQQPALSLEDLSAFRAATFLQATQRMSDAAFLEFIWQEDFDQDSVEAQNKIAERLLQLGFPDRSLVILSDEARGATADEREVLRGRAMDAVAQETVRQDALVSVRPLLSSPEAEVTLFDRDDGPTLRNSRAILQSAEQSRETIRALLESVPAPSEF